MHVLRVKRKMGEWYRNLLRAEGTMDCSCRLVEDGDGILIPLARKLSPTEMKMMVEDAGRSVEGGGSAELLEMDMPERPGLRKSPAERVAELLRERGFSDEMLERVPSKWERLGDILVIRLDGEQENNESEVSVAGAFMEMMGVRAVYADEGGITGEMRIPEVRLLAGRGSRTVHLENGIRYAMDVTKVMFSSGNIDERIHFSKIDVRGETVVDMFAGIGYFTLPLAVYGEPERIFAIEKNGDAFAFLQENVKAANVENIVVPVEGDNRDTGPRGMADRVIMGYLPAPREYLSRALSFLAADGGVIHYHHTCLGNEKERLAGDHFRKELRGTGKRYEIEGFRVIKSYAPMVYHCVADVKVVPDG